MSVSSPPPTNENIKILATKNQLLQKVEEDVRSLFSKLEYSWMNKEYKNIGNVKGDIKEAIKILKKQAIAGKVTDITEESLAKDITKGKLGDDKQVAAQKLEQLQVTKKEVSTAQEKVDELEKELRTLKAKEAKNTEHEKIREDVSEKIKKATAEKKGEIEKAKKDVETIGKQQKFLTKEEYEKKLQKAQDKVNSLSAAFVEYEENSTRNKDETYAKYTIDDTVATKIEDATDKLAKAKTKLDKHKQELSDLQKEIVKEKATNKTTFTEKISFGLLKSKKNPSDKYTVPPSTERVNNEAPRLSQEGGAEETLGELLRDYKTKIYLEETEIAALQNAFTKFKDAVDQEYTNLGTKLNNDSQKIASLNLVWKLNGFNKVFPSPTDYISNLFTKYKTALKSEQDAIKKEFPAYTDAQVKEELEKHIKGNLSPADKKAMGLEEKGAPAGPGSPGAAGQDQGDAEGSGTGSDSGEKSPSTMGSAIGKGLMDGFNILYTIFGALGAVLILGTFFLSSIDILKFSVLEVWQYIMLFINPNMFNKDTLDFSTLLYAKNKENEEPYTIFLQQEFIGYMFKLVTYFVNTVIIQVVFFIALKVLKALGKIDFDEGLDFGPAKKAIGVMVITIASAFLQNTYYNTTFLNSLQPELVASTTSIRNMAERMYDNMTNHSEFLENVVQENLTECIRIINVQAERPSVVGSMIFTLSLYNFFKINISSDTPAFDVIRDVFTLKERKIRSINPTSYMFFQQNVFIPNLYSMVEPYITTIGLKQKEMIRKDVARRISSLNQRLMGLFVVPQRRSGFRNYIYFGWILALAFVVGIYSIYREEIDLIYDNFVKPFLNAINEFFWNIVMPWDIRSSKKEERKE